MSRFVILGCGIVITSEEQRGALFLSFHPLEVMGCAIRLHGNSTRPARGESAGRRTEKAWETCAKTV